MSVRRLAEPALQPAAFAFNRAMTSEARNWIKKYPKGRQQSAVIPLLMLAQEQEGWVTKAAIEHVADMLEMPYIRVLEVATFYTQFQLKPVGTRAHIQVCGTTPCQLMGSEALMDVCRSKIHHEQFHTNADGTLSWEEVECLGACANAPMVMVFKDTYEDLTPERLGQIIDAFEAGRGEAITPGPQNGRTYAAPISGFSSLKDEKAVLKSTRDREAKSSAREAKSAAVAAAAVAPSNAAKPKTDAPETNGALKSPSKVKVPASAEQTASVAPAFSKAAANQAEPKVEGTSKQRSSAKAQPTALMAKPAAPKAAAAKPAKAAKPTLEDKNRPAGIARPAVVDDLKLISGVGPKIEKILHELGVFTFAQVAGWKKAEREWVDGYLSFSGRIDRDDWVKQAKALAKGGVAEYIRVFGKKPV
ncbi:MAG: NADH-quinone oxidoreductase subunit E [Mesorhizobium sp.]